MEYSYPFSIDWSTEEIVKVVQFFEAIEKAYESGIDRAALLERYRAFKQVVPSIGEEKKYFREFEQESGYASFPVVREMKAAPAGALIKGVR